MKGVSLVLISLCTTSLLVAKSQSTVSEKNLKHFHEPFCVCNKSPLFSKHKYDKKVHGYVRIHHIFDGLNNGFDKNTGSTLGFGLKYNQKLYKGLSGGIEYYGVTDTGLTNKNKTIAYGQFMNEKKDTKLEYGGIFGLHLSFKADNYQISIARSQFDSPLSKMQITHVPNMFEYARIDTKYMGADLSLSYITRMSYGSRSAADFGLIGEKTGTSGMVKSPFSDLERGKYYKMSDLIGDDDISGVAVVGAKKSFNNFRLELWDYYINNALNNLYLEAEYPFFHHSGYAAGLHFQYIYQDVDDKYDDKYGGSFYGIKLSTKIKKLKVNFAYNKKDDEGGFINPSGANPGYTSSIFSRNEYRSDTSSYKISAFYPILRNLKIIASYANYGKSDMLLKRKDKPSLSSQTDATERDIVLVYSPIKNLSLKLFNAKRTSEFYTSKNGKKQDHTRLIANYKF